MSTVSSGDTLASPASATSASTANPRRARRWVIVASILGVLIVFGLGVRWVGYVEGEEFSPDTFRHRNFSFYEVPYFELQISPIHRRIQSTDTATFLRQTSLVQMPTKTSATPTDGLPWHLVRIQRGMRGSKHRDAKILMEQFSIRPNSSGYWKDWSVAHPKHAKMFWPVIQKLAQRELYILMPGLFEIAQQDLTAVELQTELDGQLQRDYASLIDDAKANDRDDLVETLTAELQSDQS